MKQTARDSRSRPTAAQLRFQKIYGEIRDRIILLRYGPGTIIRETDLAEEFGVSRTPIRQVLQALQLEGLVETRNAVGTIVTGFDLASLKDAYEVRIKIGEWVGELATRSYSETDVRELEQLLKRTQELLISRDSEEYWKISNELHHVLGRVIDNTVLRETYDRLYYRTARSWFEVVPDVWENHIQTACAELIEMIKSMKAGDTRGVALVRRNYIRLFLAMIDDHLQQLGEETSSKTKTPGSNRQGPPQPQDHLQLVNLEEEPKP